MIGLLITLVSVFLFVHKRFYPSLVLFFFLASNGFQIIPSSIILAGLSGIDKTPDLCAVYILLIGLLYHKSIGNVIKREKPLKWAFFVFLFAVIVSLYSLTCLGYSFVNVLRVLRSYIFLLSFSVFIMVPLPSLVKAIKFVAFVTFAQCIIYIMQIPLNTNLLLTAGTGSEGYVSTLEGFSFSRFYNIPAYLTFALFYFLIHHKFSNKPIRYITLLMIALAIFLPLHRSFIIVTLGTLAFFNSNKSTKVAYAFSGVAVFYLLLSTGALGNRIMQAFLDLEETFTSSTASWDNSSQNTLLFRLGHFIERFSYIIESPIRWLFGLGFIVEDSPEAGRLPFAIGLMNKNLERVNQIDTSDIVWSPLLVQFGIVGSILYILFIVYLGKFFYKYKNISFSKVGFLLIIETSILSFTGNELSSNYFRILIILLCVVVIKIRDFNKLLEIQSINSQLNPTT